MSNDKDNFSVADLTAALKDEDRAGLVNALKNKLQNLAGQRSDVLENLTPKVRKRVDALRDIQSQHDELEAKFREERAVLEAKYQKLYQPLYTKRYEIVNGTTEVELAPEDTKMEQGEEKTAEEKGVPSFWLTALKNNDVTSEEVTERDEGALKYLKDIKWCKIEEPKGFKLEFFFDTNPYFKNTVLTKSYHMIDEDEPLLEKAMGTEIDHWYPGKCLTQKILKKKPKKGSKNAKPITKTEDCESFFNFFSPPQVPEEDEDIDEERAEELQNLMEQDYDIGLAFPDENNRSLKKIPKLEDPSQYSMIGLKIGSPQSIKGEITPAVTRRVTRTDEAEGSLEKDSSHNVHHPCNLFRLAGSAFLKCFGIDRSTEETDDSLRQQESKKER